MRVYIRRNNTPLPRDGVIIDYSDSEINELMQVKIDFMNTYFIVEVLDHLKKNLPHRS